MPESGEEQKLIQMESEGIKKKKEKGEMDGLERRKLSQGKP